MCMRKELLYTTSHLGSGDLVSALGLKLIGIQDQRREELNLLQETIHHKDCSFQ